MEDFAFWFDTRLKAKLITFQHVYFQAYTFLNSEAFYNMHALLQTIKNIVTVEGSCLLFLIIILQEQTTLH